MRLIFLRIQKTTMTRGSGSEILCLLENKIRKSENKISSLRPSNLTNLAKGTWTQLSRGEQSTRIYTALVFSKVMHLSGRAIRTSVHKNQSKKCGRIYSSPNLLTSALIKGPSIEFSRVAMFWIQNGCRLVMGTSKPLGTRQLDRTTLMPLKI